MFSKMAPILSNRKIMVVDDDPIHSEVIQGFLKDLGYPMLLMASSGSEALKLLSSNRVDLIFLDMNLPDMNAIKFCQKFGKNTFDRWMPIICCSSSDEFYRDRSVAKECIDVGIDDFLLKPISVKKLKDVLECWLPFEVRVD